MKTSRERREERDGSPMSVAAPTEASHNAPDTTTETKLPEAPSRLAPGSVMAKSGTISGDTDHSSAAKPFAGELANPSEPILGTSSEPPAIPSASEPAANTPSEPALATPNETTPLSPAPWEKVSTLPEGEVTMESEDTPDPFLAPRRTTDGSTAKSDLPKLEMASIEEKELDPVKKKTDFYPLCSRS